MTGSADAVALITGGTGGLGRAVVGAFLGAGCRVCVPWIDADELSTLRSDVGDPATHIHDVRADVTNANDVAKVYEYAASLGRVSVLANLVGAFSYGSFLEEDIETWERLWHLNVMSAVRCTRKALPNMLSAGFGRVINVTARPAISSGGSGGKMAAYSASKAALANFTESVATELKGSGVTVNSVAPTIIDTPANRRSMPEANRSTWVRPEQIAKIVLFLSSSEAGVISGTHLKLSV